MSEFPDRLYELLPVVYRQRDAEQGYPLRDLLRVIAEQVDVVEADIAQLYENWFIATCQDWVVPYIGDLMGYRPAHAAGETGEVRTLQGQLRNKILIPRREVANTIRYRRRKGTLALLELLVSDVTGWSARAIEFYKLLSCTQSLNHLRPNQGKTVDLRDQAAIDRLHTPFHSSAHTIEVRSIRSRYTDGWYNIFNIGVFVWRLKVYSVTKSLAGYSVNVNPNCFTFSILGNDTPLYTHPEAELEPTHTAEATHLPIPIRRHAFEERLEVNGTPRKQAATQYYGLFDDGTWKSLAIWVPGWASTDPHQPIPATQIIPADLSDWEAYEPPTDFIAVDPELGRIMFPIDQTPERSEVRVSYYYAFSHDIGGGEYDRPLTQPAQCQLYPMGSREPLQTIETALQRWQDDYQAALTASPPDPAQLERYRHGVIEIRDSGVYTIDASLQIHLPEQCSLQIRAANRTRPVIRLSCRDYLNISGEAGSCLVLDGLLIFEQGIRIHGKLQKLTVRHSTLVPGWEIHADSTAKRMEESLFLSNTETEIRIEHSIIGAIQVNHTPHDTPIAIHLSDSIIDSLTPDTEAIAAANHGFAPAHLTLVRSTILGAVKVYWVDLAENSILTGRVEVARRQKGCMRFCYVPPGSRTPRRYHCQPDLAERAIAEKLTQAFAQKSQQKNGQTSRQTSQPDVLDKALLEAAKQQECDRVRPRYNETHYGTPTYCQLAQDCAEEIKRGADDESEMGVFHNLFQPQRAANLQVRLEEYTPSGMEVGVIYVN